VGSHSGGLEKPVAVSRVKVRPMGVEAEAEREGILAEMCRYAKALT
jgi:hypothetical protein